MYTSWEDVTPQQMAKCELILTAFLTPKLDPDGHQNTFDVKFEQYKGDFMGATLHNMVKKGILWECSNKKYLDWRRDSNHSKLVRGIHSSLK